MGVLAGIASFITHSASEKSIKCRTSPNKAKGVCETQTYPVVLVHPLNLSFNCGLSLFCVDVSCDLLNYGAFLVFDQLVPDCGFMNIIWRD